MRARYYKSLNKLSSLMSKVVFRSSRDQARFLHGLRPRSDDISPL